MARSLYIFVVFFCIAAVNATILDKEDGSQVADYDNFSDGSPDLDAAKIEKENIGSPYNVAVNEHDEVLLSDEEQAGIDRIDMLDDVKTNVNNFIALDKDRVASEIQAAPNELDLGSEESENYNFHEEFNPDDETQVKIAVEKNDDDLDSDEQIVYSENEGLVDAAVMEDVGALDKGNDENEKLIPGDVTQVKILDDQIIITYKTADDRNDDDLHSDEQMAKNENEALVDAANIEDTDALDFGYDGDKHYDENEEINPAAVNHNYEYYIDEKDDTVNDYLPPYLQKIEEHFNNNLVGSNIHEQTADKGDDKDLASDEDKSGEIITEDCESEEDIVNDDLATRVKDNTLLHYPDGSNEKKTSDESKDVAEKNDEKETLNENTDGLVVSASNEDNYQENDSDHEDLFDSNETEMDDDVFKRLPQNVDGNEDTEPIEHAANENVDHTKEEIDIQNDLILNVVITTPDVKSDSSEVKSIDVEDLTTIQYDDLMKQFVSVHKEKLDTESEDFGRHVAPIHIELNTDEFTTIESPNYPNPYPTNNLVDWILDGKGRGIKFIIDDFYVNGVLGDYLLVIPGGADDSSTNGLVFSYLLKDKKEYTFLDVDRLFIRFESNPGMAFRRGFQLRVKMLDLTVEEINVPEPEPLLPSPLETLTLNFGIKLDDFVRLQGEFRDLIAGMATMYINAEQIDPGMNTTSETAQITSMRICNTNWPGYEDCAMVSFGVPLMYDDEKPYRLSAEDLKKMWDTYSGRDPFALRLEQLGITEFVSPSDVRILLVWACLGLGALASAAVIAFALWRYTCYEEYTKMDPTSDTDSIITEKRRLDLYPTPHQTLPPMFNDFAFDNKWDENDNTTRVDMGGLANNSFVRDDLFDIDSDEEGKRDSKTPKDLHKV